MKRILVTTILLFVLSACSLETAMEIKPMASDTPEVEVTTMPTVTPQIVVTSAVVVVTQVQQVTTKCRVLTGVPQGFLNLRAGAGVEYAVVTTIEEGSELEYNGKIEKGWMFVKQGENEGWVNGLYVGGCE